MKTNRLGYILISRGDPTLLSYSRIFDRKADADRFRHHLRDRFGIEANVVDIYHTQPAPTKARGPEWRPMNTAPSEGTILARLASGQLARATADVVHVGRDHEGNGGWLEPAWINEDTGETINDDDFVGWLPIGS